MIVFLHAALLVVLSSFRPTSVMSLLHASFHRRFGRPLFFFPVWPHLTFFSLGAPLSFSIILLSANMVTYQFLAMLLKGRDKPADRPRNELEEEEETVQYSQVHHSGTANGEDADDGEFGSVEEDVDLSATRSLLKQFLQDQIFIHPRSVTQRSWKRREGVVRGSCISIIIL